VEASALPSVGLARPRIGLGAPLLRLRPDEQLVSLFRAGNEEAFRVIHDRYRARLFAYTRQMLSGSSADAEDVVQEIFVRAYSGLRSHDRQLALRAWLYRIAHNRCVDEIRRPQPIATEAIEDLAINVAPDLVARVEQRDALRRLIADVQRLPEQQRSALLMRELGGMPYSHVSEALGVSVPAVKSLLVRARVGLAQAGEARDTACARIREDVIVSHDRGVRTSGLARRHIRDCPNCRQFRSEVRGVSRQFAALVPALGPIGVIAKLLGVGSASGGGAAASTGAVATSGVAAGGAGTGAVASAGVVAAGAGHVVTLLAAVAVTAGGAIELQQNLAPTAPAHHHRVVNVAPVTAGSAPAGGQRINTSQVQTVNSTAVPATSTGSRGAGQKTTQTGAAATQRQQATRQSHLRADPTGPPPLSELVDPDNIAYPPTPGDPTAVTGTGSPASGDPTTTTPTAGSPTSADPTSPTAPPAATTGTSGTAATGSPTGTGTTGTTVTTGTGAGDGTGTSSPTTTGSGTVATGTTTGSSGTTSGSSSGGAAAIGTTSTPSRTGTVVVYTSGD
jgi:RNA polymerase sigma factor (sigma-70 family)